MTAIVAFLRVSFVSVTKPKNPRCAWCGAPFVLAGGPGRPSTYCRRSHRQRAYESRRLAADRGLRDDEVLLTRSTWESLRDAIYTVEAVAQDAMTDLEDAETIADHRAIVSALVTAVGALSAQQPEPRAVG